MLVVFLKQVVSVRHLSPVFRDGGRPPSPRAFPEARLPFTHSSRAMPLCCRCTGPSSPWPQAGHQPLLLFASPGVGSANDVHSGQRPSPSRAPPAVWRRAAAARGPSRCAPCCDCRHQRRCRPRRSEPDPSCPALRRRDVVASPSPSCGVLPSISARRHRSVVVVGLMFCSCSTYLLADYNKPDWSGGNT